MYLWLEVGGLDDFLDRKALLRRILECDFKDVLDLVMKDLLRCVECFYCTRCDLWMCCWNVKPSLNIVEHAQAPNEHPPR
jgi:hypothetical protein